MPATDFTNSKACYLEFNAPDQLAHFIESAFYLRDDGSLSAQSKGGFASPYATLRFEYFANTPNTLPTCRFTLPKPNLSPKSQQFSGTVWGVKFRYVPPATIQQLPMEILKQIAETQSGPSHQCASIEATRQSLGKTCEFLSTLLTGHAATPGIHQTIQSKRSHRRHFKARMGLSPKPFGSLTRFQGTLTDITATKDPLSQIAYRNTFADQAHLSRDFRAKTGHTPAQFRQIWKENASVRFLQDQQQDHALRLGIVID